MSDKVLTQSEIDALFARYENQPIQKEAEEFLNLQELDTIGEIGNICMGTAATTLSQILNHKVVIGYPKVIVCNQDEVFSSFLTPYLIIEVGFKAGLNGFNVMVISEEEVAVIADIMMGGSGEVARPIVITDMELSASTEAMNQMIGASATAMAELFGISIDIAPPKAKMVEDLVNADHSPLPTDKPVVVARFEITIGDIIKTTFMQITNVDAARDQANFLIMKAGMVEGAESSSVQSTDNSLDMLSSPALLGNALPNLTGALAVPLELDFSLARTRCTVGDLARLQVGDTIPLAGQPKYVELLVGGMPVGQGEIVDKGDSTEVKILRLYQTGLAKG